MNKNIKILIITLIAAGLLNFGSVNAFALNFDFIKKNDSSNVKTAKTEKVKKAKPAKKKKKRRI